MSRNPDWTGSWRNGPLSLTGRKASQQEKNCVLILTHLHAWPERRTSRPCGLNPCDYNRSGNKTDRTRPLVTRRCASAGKPTAMLVNEIHQWRLNPSSGMFERHSDGMKRSNPLVLNRCFVSVEKGGKRVSSEMKRNIFGRRSNPFEKRELKRKGRKRDRATPSRDSLEKRFGVRRAEGAGGQRLNDV
jgi:hypothetical protein